MQEERSGWGTVSHHDMSERKNTNRQPDKRPIIHLLFLFLMILFFHFVVSTMKLHALAGRSKSNIKTSTGKRMRKLKRLPPKFARLHIFSIFFHVTFLQVYGPTWPTTPLFTPHLQLRAAQGPDLAATCLGATTLSRFIRSALSLLSFLIGQSWWHHLMVWHICTKWLVFVYLSKYQGVLQWEKR